MLEFNSSPLPPHSGKVRRADRYALPIPGVLREPGVPKFNVMVRDVSVTGFACDTSHVMQVGAQVWIQMAGLAPLEAEVKWRDEFYYGFAFVRPLYPAVLEHIAKQTGQRR
jgi:hypothetical protein